MTGKPAGRKKICQNFGKSGVSQGESAGWKTRF